MVLILGVQPEGYRSIKKFFVEQRLNILPRDNRGQRSRIPRQRKAAYILNELGKLWKSQGTFEYDHNITIISRIHRGSHEGKHIIARTSNNEVTSFRIMQSPSNKTRGLETQMYKSPKDHQN